MLVNSVCEHCPSQSPASIGKHISSGSWRMLSSIQSHQTTRWNGCIPNIGLQDFLCFYILLLQDPKGTSDMSQMNVKWTISYRFWGNTTLFNLWKMLFSYKKMPCTIFHHMSFPLIPSLVQISGLMARIYSWAKNHQELRGCKSPKIHGSIKLVA